MKRLSTGFAGSQTKKFGGVDKEVEIRLGKLGRLEGFKEEFRPPGAREAVPGSDFSKRNAPYEKPHDDLAAAGNASDQEKLDWLDEQQQKVTAPIKPQSEQFPGANKMASDVGKFDVHSVDPARLFNKRVETKLKKMVNGDTKSDNADLNDQRRFKKK